MLDIDAWHFKENDREEAMQGKGLGSERMQGQNVRAIPYEPYWGVTNCSGITLEYLAHPTVLVLGLGLGECVGYNTINRVIPWQCNFK